MEEIRIEMQRHYDDDGNDLWKNNTEPGWVKLSYPVVETNEVIPQLKDGSFVVTNNKTVDIVIENYLIKPATFTVTTENVFDVKTVLKKVHEIYVQIYKEEAETTIPIMTPWECHINDYYFGRNDTNGKYGIEEYDIIHILIHGLLYDREKNIIKPIVYR